MDSGSDDASLTSTACTDARKRKVSYFYESTVGDYYYGQGHPMKLHRINDHYSFHHRMEISAPFPAQPACSMSPPEAPLVPPKDADIAINWAGGLHHAKKSQTSRSCYVNNIVLGIVQLLKQELLYIDIDVHHVDGVEEAFYTTDRVMAVSFQKFCDFPPESGHIKDAGAGPGKYYALNVPLSDGLKEDDFRSLFHTIIDEVMQVYQPDTVILQCGADSLGGDRFGLFEMSVKGHRDTVRFLSSFNVQLMLLGGGGYRISNVGRCWCHETAIALHVEPSNIANLDTKNDLEKIRTYLLEQIGRLQYVLSVTPPPITAVPVKGCEYGYNPHYFLCSHLLGSSYSEILCPFRERTHRVDMCLDTFQVIGQYTPTLQAPNWFILLSGRVIILFNVRTRVYVNLPEVPHIPHSNLFAAFWGNPDANFTVLIVELGMFLIWSTPFCSTRGWGESITFDTNDGFHTAQGQITLSNELWWVNLNTWRIYCFRNVGESLFHLAPPTVAELRVRRHFDCVCSMFDHQGSFIMFMWEDEHPNLHRLFKLGDLVTHPLQPLPEYEVTDYEPHYWQAVMASADGPGMVTTIGSYVGCSKKIFVSTTMNEHCIRIDGLEVAPRRIKSCFLPYNGYCCCRGYIVIL